MRKAILTVLFVCIFLMDVTCSSIQIIPWPFKIIELKGELKVSISNNYISYSKSISNEAIFLRKVLKNEFGVEFKQAIKLNEINNAYCRLDD